MTLHLLEILRDLSWLLYIGPMLSFTVLIHLSRNTETIVTSFQEWGMGFGLSLGSCIFFAVSLYYLQHQTFYLDFTSRTLFSCGILVGLVMWVSNLKLEVWTLDPLRKIRPEDTPQRAAAIQSLKSHLRIHAALVLATDLLCRLGETL